MEGGIVDGLTAAMKVQITSGQSRAQQSNYHDYPLLRFSEMPLIEVYIIESDAHPIGIGKMEVSPIAPAITNAVFAATGKRIRKILIFKEDLAENA
ncbi:MAG: xanthine dehydrogenase family protein molybdopterin-binding subunit [Anaerolineales bacterium]|nr:xanthine dehydrogenase family protein molybdopterin-binding subunit [Anaerolineales bacterium]